MVKVDIGITGTGYIVKEFLPVLAKIPGLRCSAICGTKRSINEIKNICADYNISRGVTDYKELLNSDIDTVYIAVPNNLHYKFCLDALNANKNVIVEKPITSNFKEALKLSNLAKDKKLFLYEAITTRYLKNYIKIKELLHKIGTVKLVECNFSQYSHRYDAFLEGNAAPVFKPENSGGALYDLNLYNIHYVTGIFGAPNNVEYYANMDRGIDTSGVLIMNYSGFNAVCIAAKDCGAPSHCLIEGTKGYIFQNTASSICGAVTLHLNDGTEETFDINGDEHRMESEFNTFVKNIEEGNQDHCFNMLNQSLIASNVMNKARNFAGIQFPADLEAL